MQSRSRRSAAASTGAWIAAMLALAPLAALFWAVRTTGMGIA